MTPRWLIVGLGNPGPRYLLSRHNAGFLIVDAFAEAHGLRWQRTPLADVAEGRIGEGVLLAKPLTFMNLSGEAVRELVDRYGLPLDRVLVVHDDIDLPFGRLRVKRGGGHGGHRGVASVMEALGGEGFPRLKVGVGRPGRKEEVVDHVLSPFSEEERSNLPEVMERAVGALEAILLRGLDEAMNLYNR